jgi:FAD/FMN-containing dehydrogenase/Fe-S oxidoreductase
MSFREKLITLRKNLEGEFYFDYTHCILYSTDASAYKEMPAAVAVPKNTADIRKLIDFARKEKTSLIPRGAGTSLAGQVTGSGIVVDVSKHLNKILNFDKEKKQITVEPGVILSELNLFLKPHGLFFGPETSTANRCTIGGMVGNNACGLHSLVYGSTRDHLISVKAFLADGSFAEFKDLTKSEFEKKLKLENPEGELYRSISRILSDKQIFETIENEYPEKFVKRRNTGYALDLLADSSVFKETENNFNFCKLIAGSEGTLAFITEITLNLLPLPPKHKALLIPHFNKISEVFDANLIALKNNPTAVELSDKNILTAALENKEQTENRFFINGNPDAILIIEFIRETPEELETVLNKTESDLRTVGLGFHYSRAFGSEIEKIWDFRKAGLGLLSNLSGDSSPVSLVEDTAINPEKLKNYISDFNILLEKYKLSCVYHAHIGTGELHLRPILNLKKSEDVKIFNDFAFETAVLVKKYKGSLSGEHGDGRLRGEFIPLMYGDLIYSIFKEIKKSWDPENIFNPGKITDTPPMTEFLRFRADEKTLEFSTHFNFSKTVGIVRASEKCNGSGDCIKSVNSGGTICPSYKATNLETHSTRGRANLFREILKSENEPFKNTELYKILDDCLSCKGCKSECPSNVDVTKLKAEFLQHYYNSRKIPWQSRIIANFGLIFRILSKTPKISNLVIQNRFFSKIFSLLSGFTEKRNLPTLSKITVKKFHRKNQKPENSESKKVWFFVDEFTDTTDSEIGIKTILLLETLNYGVRILPFGESGRTYLSKGFVKKARKIAAKNLSIYNQLNDSKTPIIGTEPSALLTFRDEYCDFFNSNIPEEKTVSESAQNMAKQSFTIEEFLQREMKNGNIKKNRFHFENKKIYFHGHCYQKALSAENPTKFILSFPENYEAVEIPSGCCGMAGAFGYEKNHYELSIKVGETVLFPFIRNLSKADIIAASGTSCRHQIEHGTNRIAFHPIEILLNAINQNQ